MTHCIGWHAPDGCPHWGGDHHGCRLDNHRSRVHVCECGARCDGLGGRRGQVVTPWRIFRAAAVADSRALRLLPPGTRVAPTDLAAALDDAAYLDMRDRESARAREYRRRMREEAA